MVILYNTNTSMRLQLSSNVVALIGAINEDIINALRSMVRRVLFCDEPSAVTMRMMMACPLHMIRIISLVINAHSARIDYMSCFVSDIACAACQCSSRELTPVLSPTFRGSVRDVVLKFPYCQRVPRVVSLSSPFRIMLAQMNPGLVLAFLYRVQVALFMAWGSSSPSNAFD